MTREEMHRLVWTMPLTELSKQFGVTATGLAKICDRHSIPRPPQGHWIRLEVGKKVSVTPLPPVQEGQSEQFEIAPPEKKHPENPVVSAVLSEARFLVSGVTELNEFTKLHSKVKRWVGQHRDDQAERRRERRERHRDAWSFVRDPIPDLTERDRYRFQTTSTVFRAVEEAGATVVDAKIIGKFHLKVGEHTLECWIKEKMRQDLREVDKSWSAYPEHHQLGLHSSGLLRFTVSTYVGGKRLEWVETQKKKMLDLLPTIVGELIACGPRLDQQEAEREARRIAFEEERRRQYEEQQRREVEQRRWAHFVEQACAWEQASRVRSFIDQVERRLEQEEVADIDGRSARTWLERSKNKVAATDPLLGDLSLLWKLPSRW